MPSPTRVFGRIRDVCLSFPEASEVSAWGHPVFRVRRKAFVAFEQVRERPSIAFRLDPLEVERLLERPSRFSLRRTGGDYGSASGLTGR